MCIHGKKRYFNFQKPAGRCYNSLKTKVILLGRRNGEKKTARPVSHTALPTARTSGLYGPVPPRQHSTSCPPGTRSGTRGHLDDTIPPRQRHAIPIAPVQVYICDEEKRREIPGKARKRSNAIRNVPHIRAAQAEQPASVGGFIPCPFNLLAHHLPAAPLPKQTPAEPSHPSPHASHHSSTASLPLRAASRLAGAAGSDGGWRSTRQCEGAPTAACAPSTATPSTSSSGPSRSTRKLPLCSLPPSSTSWAAGRADWVSGGAGGGVLGPRRSGGGGSSRFMARGRSPRARSGRGLGRARWRGACAGPPFGLVDPEEG